MSAISYPGGGGSSSSGGGPVTDILVAIRDYIKYLCNPSWVDKALNRERVTAVLEATTLTTVTTVTGVTNLDSYQARVALLGANYSAWALCVRARIS